MPDRDELIKRLVAALVVSDARRSGDPQLAVDVLVVSAIDMVTVAHSRVGVLEDSGIALTSGELDAFGFTPGVGEPNGGWADRGYGERRHPV